MEKDVPPRPSTNAVMDRRPLLLTAVLAVAIPSIAVAGKVSMKNGTVLEGDIARIESLTDQPPPKGASEIRVTPFILIESGHKRYFLHDRQRVEIDPAQTLIPFDIFELPNKRSPKSLQVASVGLPLQVTPFDDKGRRTVTLETPQGQRPIVQGVTQLSPQYVTVEGITHSWWQGIATKAVPPEQLSAMLHSSIDEENPDDRMAIARFYVQAGLYEAAAAELQAISSDFSFLAGKVAELDRELKQLRANGLLAEIRRRQAAGQHSLALFAAESFPTDEGFDADVLQQVEALREGYRTAREKGDEALLLLGELEAQLEDPEQRAAVTGLRPLIREQLNWDTLSRLDSFLKLAGDDSLSPGERLALAYSGWAVGSANATTELTTALALWRARYLVGEYLRDDDVARRGALISELSQLEGIGPDALMSLVPYLPPWVETPTVVPGTVSVLETGDRVPGWGQHDGESGLLANVSAPARYAVALPPDYVPTRSYPMVVALRPAEWTIEQTAEFWGVARDAGGRPAPGPATQAGYIVIAPEYASEKQEEFGYAAREHLAILAAIRDAKKRFPIDSDRVYLAGHGMGADATFDVACSHPDLFAGAVPISGLCKQHVKYYKQNAERVPFYVINGSLDRNAREVNADDLGWMMKHGHDVLYCEFIGRGYEYFFEELPRVLEWMARLRRVPDPASIEVKVLRASDDRFYWVTAEGIPQNLLVGDVANPRGRTAPRPMTLSARITPGNTITLTSAATRYVLRLNGTLVDLDERVKVRTGSRQAFNDFLVPDSAALLDDLARNGDRQRLYPIRLVVD